MTRCILGALAASAALALAAPAGALDLPRFDLGAGYAQFTVEDIDLDALALRGTFHLNDFIGAEAEGMVGISEETVGLVDLELERSLGLYARGDIQLFDTVGLFARAGYVDVEVDGLALVAPVPGTGSGWAGGVGAELFFFGPLGASGLRADYTHFELEDGDGDGEIISISFVRRFGR